MPNAIMQTVVTVDEWIQDTKIGLEPFENRVPFSSGLRNRVPPKLSAFQKIKFSVDLKFIERDEM